MSSHKHRSKDKHRPSSDKKYSSSNVSNRYERSNYEDDTDFSNHHPLDNELEDHSKKRKRYRSKDRSHEKTKKSNSHEGNSEHHKAGYSKTSEHSRKRKDDDNESENSTNGRDSQTKDYGPNNDYYFQKEVMNSEYRSYHQKEKRTEKYDFQKEVMNSEYRSYRQKEKRTEKYEKERNYQTKECISDEGKSDSYCSTTVRNQNPDHSSSYSRKDKRYRKYDHSSEDDCNVSKPYYRGSQSKKDLSDDEDSNVSKPYYRGSQSKKDLSDDEDSNVSKPYYRGSQSKKDLSDDEDSNNHSNSEVEIRNSERSLCNRKDKKHQKSRHSYASYNRDVRQSDTGRKDDHNFSRVKEAYRRRRASSSEEESFHGRRVGTHDKSRVQAVAEDVNQDVRSHDSRNLKPNSDVHREKNNQNNAKTPKKTVISGAYIPPAKLKLMQQEITDKGSIEYQRIAWEALKKSINGLTNKINTSNIIDIVKELFKENIIRGRGVLTRALMQAQALSPTFTHVYAGLVAVINTKFPEISELLLKRLILQFKRGFRRNDKQACLSSVRFMAHLLNQQVAHEVLILEALTLLLERPTDHSVEVAIAMLKECGKRLEELSKRGCDAIFSRLRHVLHEGNLDKRTQYMIEVLFAVRKDKFKDYPSVVKELDLVEENDKFTHLVTLDEALESEEMLNVFKFDSDYEANEERYRVLVKEILGDSDSEDSDVSEAEDSHSDEENDEDGESQKIVDMTETNLVALRRNIYLTIQSSLDFEECAHKLLKMELKPGEIMEMCYMILDCCAQQRTYEKFYGLLAQRFCQLNRVYLEPFMEIFRNSYETIHRLETNKLRNVAKFFAHLLYTDAIHWNVLSYIKLNENDTTSSSRIFIKILFQELCEYMGLPLLNERVKDVTLQEAFDGLFPRDNPHNTRFAINFFTSIGLGGLTDELREHLKTAPKNPAVIPTIDEKPSESSSENSSPDGSSADSSSSESDSEDEEPPRKKSKKRSQQTSTGSQKNERKSSRSDKHKSHKKSNKHSHSKQKHRH